MKRIFTRIFLIAGILMCLAQPFVLLIKAENIIDLQNKGTITIVFPPADTDFHLYRIAEIKEDASLVYRKPYELPDLSLSDSEQWETIAETEAKLIEKLQLPPEYSIHLKDHKGTVTNLPMGVYLVIGLPQETDHVRYSPVPFLISLPQWDGEGYSDSVWIDLVKYTREDTEWKEYEVIKQWEGDNAGNTRPSFVSIDLYEGSDRIKTIKLNETNQWRYRWKGNKEEVWRAEEQPVSDYSTEIRVKTEGNRTVFTITNRYIPKRNIPSTRDRNIFHTALIMSVALCISIFSLIMMIRIRRK